MYTINHLIKSKCQLRKWQVNQVTSRHTVNSITDTYYHSILVAVILKNYSKLLSLLPYLTLIPLNFLNGLAYLLFLYLSISGDVNIFKICLLAWLYTGDKSSLQISFQRCMVNSYLSVFEIQETTFLCNTCCNVISYICGKR